MSVSTHRFVLPAELTIYEVTELREQWLAALADLEPAMAACEIDASVVLEVDGAGVQCLLGLSRALADRRCRLRLVAPSDALRDACATLGLGHLVDADADAVAATDEVTA